VAPAKAAAGVIATAPGWVAPKARAGAESATDGERVAAASPAVTRGRGLFRSSPKDAYLLGALLVETGAVVVVARFVAPRGVAGAAIAACLFALGVCWCSNTVAHVHLHRPLFRARRLNRALSLWITLVTLVPQSLWRQRHFWHHAGERGRFRLRFTEALFAEAALLAALAIVVGVCARAEASFAMAGGFVLGMGLCSLQGRMEHRADARVGGVSYYGRLYNALCFNDGHHAEHHAAPRLHWTRLPEQRRASSRHVSALPPLARTFEHFVPRVLCSLERGVLAIEFLQRWVLGVHLRALAGLVGELPFPPARVVIVGGGLFPRSFLALRPLLPASRFVIVDQSARHIEAAQNYLERAGVPPGKVEFRCATFDAAFVGRGDLVVVPLAYEGSRGAFGLGAAVITHDWIWRRGPVSQKVSFFLLKRVNLLLP
jgi:hypothetical protein